MPVRMPAAGDEACVYLVPSVLSDTGYASIPPSVRDAVAACSAFFVEDERTARRYLKRLMPGFVVDDHAWHRMTPGDGEVRKAFNEVLDGGGRAGILSEAGCPGIADPGQELVAIAQDRGVRVVPLSGPNSMLLALMASGMNGQLFRFDGYLPVDADARRRALRELESDSARTGCTHILIETPYRNDRLLEAMLQALRPTTRVCVAVDVTGEGERIRTRRVSEWRREAMSIGKTPAIFLVSASEG